MLLTNNNKMIKRIKLEDLSVGIHPRRITTREQADYVLSKLDNFETLFDNEAVVALMQNDQSGGSYVIKSRTDADYCLKNPRKSERIVEYFDRSYFTELRTKLT